MIAEVDVFPAVVSLLLNKPTNCDCSLKELLMMGIVNKPTTARKTSTSAFIRNREAVTAV
jgi:hypothetical protein